MILASTISKERPAHISLDYERLRTEGISHLEGLATKIWTDFNAHDPGITLLEVLCYALTDLAYRTDFDIETLLAEPIPPFGAPLSKHRQKKHFSRPDAVLTSHPVTPNDFRRVLIDMAGVKNAWFEKAIESVKIPAGRGKSFDLNGLYKIIVDLDDAVPTFNTITVDKIKDAMMHRLHAYRNLCEDFAEIIIVEQKPLTLCIDVAMAANADANKLKAAILHRLELYLTPDIPFYSLDKLLTEGYDCEAIYQGPLLENGFIKEDDLERYNTHSPILYKSDMIAEILKIEGIERVNDFTFKFENEPNSAFTTNKVKWCIKAPTPTPPFKWVLDNETKIHLTLNDLEIATADEAVSEELYFLQMANTPLKPCAERPAPPTLVETEGNLTDYTPIEYDLPDTYAVGDNRLPESASALRHAQAKQLRGFLLFFDQILANYLAQLGEARNLLSENQSPNAATSFFQVLGNTEGLLPADMKAELAKIVESSSEQQIRKNNILNHLLARFGASFTDYTLGLWTNQISSDDYGKDLDDYLEDKANYLEVIAELGRERPKAYNIKRFSGNTKMPDVWGTRQGGSKNVEGVKKRVCRLIGISDYGRQSLVAESLFDIQIQDSEDELGRTLYTLILKDKKGTVLMQGKPLRFSAKDIQSRRERAYLAAIEPKTSAGLTGFGLVTVQDISPRKKNPNDHYVALYANIDKANEPLMQSEAAPFAIAAETLRYLERLAKPDVPNEEGFHIVEHILLRPNDAADDLLNLPFNTEGVEPYSFWLTVVLPNWTPRFSNAQFQQQFADIFRSETPAHIAARLVWLNNEQMLTFETAYKKWLVEKARCTADECKVTEVANELIAILNGYGQRGYMDFIEI